MVRYTIERYVSGTTPDSLIMIPEEIIRLIRK
jgi:hypothetical protein